jgi:hypothetical protein
MTTEEKEDSSTLRIETSENDSTKSTNEKKVMVGTPISKTEYRQSQAHHSSSGGVKEKQQKSIATKAKGVGQSIKT